MYKPTSLDEVIAALPIERQQAIAARGAELIKKIQRRMTLAEVRKQRKITQTQLAETLGIDQVQVSRMERRKDPRLSTIQRTVASMGGHLTMIATFPDQEPVILVAASASTGKAVAPGTATKPMKRRVAAKAA